MHSARLHVLSVCAPDYASMSQFQSSLQSAHHDARQREARQRVATAADACAAAGLACETHVVGVENPWEAIIGHARRFDCDLIVMASHGRRGVSALLLGSETQKVLTHTTIPVLVVR